MNPRIIKPPLDLDPGTAAATLPVSEAFYSIQGEGKLTGTPSFFIRVAGCNLRCAWCDTPYASWSPEGAPVSIDDLAGAAAATPARHIVLTGGEPMMFPQIEPLCRLLQGRGLHITIETAGTIFRDVPCDLMSISPKLANSTPQAGDPRDPGGVWRERHEERRFNPEVLRALVERYPERQLKFVVNSPDDCREIEAMLSQLPGLAPGDVLLMPEGVASPGPEQVEWLVRECLGRGWRLCVRLHLQLFGNRRGT